MSHCYSHYPLPTPSATFLRFNLALASAVVFASLATPAHSQISDVPDTESDASAVRNSEPLDAQNELAEFQVADGFSVTLFASEPQIQKPVNMAFDHRGRLWVTGSQAYPFPAKPGEEHDSVRILEDTNGDGSADKVTVFADDLNIPMGLYPYQDGVVVFSIPNILFLRDTDNDGKADKREILYGPFDTSRDTHGMNNSFRRAHDGWLYCCHGFNNESTVAGTDGHKVTLTSGNTYRIRLDGSRIEHITHGQVNPFGMTIDEFGDLYNSDCHTRPVSLLLPGGFYESFGKPHDGLGFVPPTMDHLHGSTAIDGLCQYQGIQFPETYRNDLFVGNVMTNRIHRNSIVRIGSTVRMNEEADFLVSSDPWFRPVDIQSGPDGALYVADFYNRIIGHYEVPLDHPGRDRERGRIWRIAYTGDQDTATQVTRRTLKTEDPKSLIEALGDKRKFVRQHAADALVDSIGDPAIPAVEMALTDSLESPDQTDTPQLLWILNRLNVVSLEQLESAFQAGNLRTRVHVQRVASEFTDKSVLKPLIRKGLRDPEGLVRRAAGLAASKCPSVDTAKEIVNALVVCEAADVHLKHALKIALKHQLSTPEVASWFAANAPPKAACEPLADVIVAVPGESAGKLAMQLIETGYLPDGKSESLVRHAAQNLSSQSALRLFEIARALPPESQRLATEIWLSLFESFQNDGVKPPAAFLSWSYQLANDALLNTEVDRFDWGAYSWGNSEPGAWEIESRFQSADATRKLEFLSSLPGGENATGLIRSRPFVLPVRVSAQICGHLGFPESPPLPENRVVLREHLTGQVISSALAPRDDTATTAEWKSGLFAGQRAYLEVVDGISDSAFAWIAIGSVSPSVINHRMASEDQVSAVADAMQILEDLLSLDYSLQEPQLARITELMNAVHVAGRIRARSARLLLLHHHRHVMLPIAELLSRGETPRLATSRIASYCVSNSTNASEEQHPDETQENNTPPSVDSVEQRTPNGTSTPPGSNVEVESPELEMLRVIIPLLDGPTRSEFALKISATQEGSRILLDMFAGGILPDLLRDQHLAKQVSSFSKQFADRVKAIVDSLPLPAHNADELAQVVLKRLRLQEGQPNNGALVFQKNCRNCHQIRGAGGVAGPQLDGIGSRGPARVLEDILYPNRNVDKAFRSTTLSMNDGKVITGIIRRAEDPFTVHLLDTNGKLTRIPIRSIEEKSESRLSLMPSNVSTTLSEQELLDLLTYLVN